MLPLATFAGMLLTLTPLAPLGIALIFVSPTLLNAHSMA